MGGKAFSEEKPKAKALVGSKSFQTWKTDKVVQTRPFFKRRRQRRGGRKKKKISAWRVLRNTVPLPRATTVYQKRLPHPLYSLPSLQTLCSIILPMSRKSLEIFGKEIMCHYGTKKAKNSAQTDFTGGCFSPFFFYEGWASRGTREVVLGCMKREGENWIKEYQSYVLWGFYAPSHTFPKW